MRHRFHLLSLGATLLLASSASAAGATDASAPAQTTVSDAGARQTVDAGPAETSDQRAYRYKYIADTAQKESSLMKGLIWTPEVRKAEAAHWRRAYRTLRIRELAEDGGDTATVARTDLFLRKIDGHFFAFLSETAPTLPTQPAAPVITAPAPNAQVAIGSALTVTMTPAAGTTPTNYFIVASEGQAALNNYDQAGKQWGTSPSVTFAATDARWAKFVSKKGGIWVAAGTKATSPKGVAYTQWSAQRYIPVTYVGGAAPASTGGTP